MRNRTIATMLASTWLTFAQMCPNPPVASIASSTIPADVCIPKEFSDLTIDFFDDYSWKTLVAMVSPLDRRGPKQFEKFTPLWAVFHEDGSAPGIDAAYNACSAAIQPGDLVLASFNGFGDIGQAGDGALLGPLVAQNGRYVRYLTAYNEIAYEHIVKNRWYLRNHLPEVPVPKPPAPPMQFPVGSAVVKSAWVEMTGFSDAQRARFYTRKAVVRDPASGKCTETDVGLLGIHIVQKTASRPQWIWSSFEQVDSVPPGEPGSRAGFILNDGAEVPMPETNPLELLPLANQPLKPFNVVRSEKFPIHPKTVLTNQKYRKLLESTVWRNYQLVVTQWPLAPGDQSIPVSPTQAGDIFQTFPGEGATSAFANMSMETFNQNRPAQGCMNCHNRARMTADFMWSVFEHAYPAKIVLPPPVR